jgi:hypothetical protein
MQITRHGRKVWYFRRNRDERRVRLPDVYGSQEFMDAYQVCLAGGMIQAVGRRGASRGKLAWLIELYMKSGKWASYQPATQKARGHILQKLAEEKGWSTSRTSIARRSWPRSRSAATRPSRRT